MPDQSLPSSTPNTQATPDELNLSETGIDKPRLKRRSLKGRSTSTEVARPGLETSSSSSSLSDSSRSDYPRPDEPRPESISRAPSASSAPAAKPAVGNPFISPSANPAPSAQSLPTTPLYYTTGVRKDKEPASPMKTSSPSTSASSVSAAAASASSTQARPAAQAPASSASMARPATASSPSSATRPAGQAAASTFSSQARPATASPQQGRPTSSSASPTNSFTSTPSVAAPARSASTNDYKANVERQSREQKSVGGMIAMVVYTLVALFVLGSVLAIYGAVAISKQMHQQSLTMSDLDSRYTAENQALTAQLKASNDSLTEALTQTQAQLKRQQELLAHQQDFLNKVSAADEINIATLRQERQARTAEESSLRARIHLLEAQTRVAPAIR